MAAELRATEERLRLAVDNAEVSFWDVALVNDVLIWPARTEGDVRISADVPVTSRISTTGYTRRTAQRRAKHSPRLLTDTSRALRRRLPHGRQGGRDYPLGGRQGTRRVR